MKPRLFLLALAVLISASAVQPPGSTPTIAPSSTVAPIFMPTVTPTLIPLTGNQVRLDVTRLSRRHAGAPPAVAGHPLGYRRFGRRHVDRDV